MVRVLAISDFFTYGAVYVREVDKKSDSVILALRHAQDRLTFGQAGIQYFQKAGHRPSPV
ncbi:MAG: hypothetical protein Q7T21_10460 [Gallionella sp.]|nr:hypothetical protein [Gallionella sp.]